MSLQAQQVQLAFQNAVALHRQGQLAQADALCAAVLQVQPLHFQASHMRGLIALSVGQVTQGIELIQRSLAVNPNQPAAHSNIGNALLAAGEPAQALASFDAALRLQPDYAVAHYNRAVALVQLGRLHAARAAFDQTLGLDPRNVDALLGRGNLFRRLNLAELALRDCEQAFSIAPQSLAALVSAGAALMDLNRWEPALARYERLLQVSSANVDALYGRAAALLRLGRMQEGERACEEVLRAVPSHYAALGDLFLLRMNGCDWRDYDALSNRVRASLEETNRFVNPLLLMLFDSPELNLSCARGFVQDRLSSAQPLPATPVSHDRPTKIRVGYISADFRDHPVSQLLVGVLERHDRDQFEVVGVGLRPVGDDAIGHRLQAAFDRYVDVSNFGDAEAAKLMRVASIDIAVDLMGYTDGMRPGILAHRPAPIQVNYLGYAATEGASHIDYLLADAVTIAQEEQRWYDEQIVRLPGSFLPNDDRRQIAATLTRREAGLPDEGFVFCAFTKAHKINPPMFNVWMRLLQGCDGSVLWLRQMDAAAQERLIQEATARGVAAGRLIFAPRVSDPAQYLGRLALADLYLDTLPYNAHSTCCEALWAGVPVITCSGRSFASRVAASALTAAGLPELITHSLQDYEHRALELARYYPSRLVELRLRLSQMRSHSMLFDTARYTRELESAYRSMYERARRGGTPAGFTVAAPGRQ